MSTRSPPSSREKGDDHDRERQPDDKNRKRLCEPSTRAADLTHRARVLGRLGQSLGNDRARLGERGPGLFGGQRVVGVTLNENPALRALGHSVKAGLVVDDLPDDLAIEQEIVGLGRARDVAKAPRAGSLDLDQLGQRPRPARLAHRRGDHARGS